MTRDDITLDPAARMVAFAAAQPLLERGAAPFHVIDEAIRAYLKALDADAVFERTREPTLDEIDAAARAMADGQLWAGAYDSMDRQAWGGSSAEKDIWRGHAERGLRAAFAIRSLPFEDSP
jgi:NADPH:quinone reductase-like Zn-dependent oxidoreductase